MSDTSNSSICMPVDNRPLQEPDASCEGCGTRGTVGRASRHDASGVFVEEHRYGADCWPEWSAFYRARWEEQGRRETDAWLDRPADSTNAPPPPPPAAWGMVFGSATWYDVLDLVRQLRQSFRFHRNPPTREALAQVAAQIREHAAERVGPMPLEVRAFLEEFGADNPPAADERRAPERRAQSPE